jgi:hypothetical protein
MIWRRINSSMKSPINFENDQRPTTKLILLDSLLQEKEIFFFENPCCNTPHNLSIFYFSNAHPSWDAGKTSKLSHSKGAIHGKTSMI